MSHQRMSLVNRAQHAFLADAWKPQLCLIFIVRESGEKWLKRQDPRTGAKWGEVFRRQRFDCFSTAPSTSATLIVVRHDAIRKKEEAHKVKVRRTFRTGYDSGPRTCVYQHRWHSPYTPSSTAHLIHIHSMLLCILGVGLSLFELPASRSLWFADLTTLQPRPAIRQRCEIYTGLINTTSGCMR
jgi:hypothetical protein